MHIIVSEAGDAGSSRRGEQITSREARDICEVFPVEVETPERSENELRGAVESVRADTAVALLLVELEVDTFEASGTARPRSRASAMTVSSKRSSVIPLTRRRTSCSYNSVENTKELVASASSAFR